MKKVILIGDSIRMGYQPVVSDLLSGTAEVWGPDQNGGNSRNVLSRLGEWVFEKSPDIIHINCGLHDIKKEKDSGEIAVPVGEYAENVENIFNAISAHTEAKIIWAATTPVNYAWHHAKKEFDRFEEDVSAYNRIAADLAELKGIEVNDLNKVITDKGPNSLLNPDGVHFDETGYKLLGEAAANFIKPFL